MKKNCKICSKEFEVFSNLENRCFECKRDKFLENKKKKRNKKRSGTVSFSRHKKIQSPRSNYKEVYRKFFGYEKGEIILCEYSGKVADDIHHIKYKSQGGEDVIENLMALSRDIHNRAHFKEEPYIQADELTKIHLENIKGVL